MNVNIIINCPHCDDFVLIEELNCCIFRHGTLIASHEQISPHAPETLCIYYVDNNLIYGCGKPFKIILNKNNEYIAVACDYI